MTARQIRGRIPCLPKPTTTSELPSTPIHSPNTFAPHTRSLHTLAAIEKYPTYYERRIHEYPPVSSEPSQTPTLPNSAPSASRPRSARRPRYQLTGDGPEASKPTSLPRPQRSHKKKPPECPQHPKPTASPPPRRPKTLKPNLNPKAPPQTPNRNPRRPPKPAPPRPLPQPRPRAPATPASSSSSSPRRA